jgi:hypothetical protein
MKAARVERPETKDVRLPAALGECADQLYRLREKRALLEKHVDAIKVEEGVLREHLINTLPLSKAEGIVGKAARAVIIQKVIPQVQDWAKFYKYILKHKAFELLQRRPSDVAIKERWDSTLQVPGVVPFKVKIVSVTKK